MSKTPSKYQQFSADSIPFKLFMLYDILMVLVILLNLICLIADYILMSQSGGWIISQLQLGNFLEFYRRHLHPWVVITEAWFVGFLIIELLVRWIIAIVYRHHSRWFFFPFIHWYEVLAIFPMLRFLRLFRAGIIVYRLQQVGYHIIPKSWLDKAYFYYGVVMEEISDQVILRVLRGVESELNSNQSHKKLIHGLVDRHREPLKQVLTEILQQELATELKSQQLHMSEQVGQIVNRAIEQTPELTQLLRLIPLVGTRIEQQIQSIGQRLGENITYGLVQPFTTGTVDQPNSNYELIADGISNVDLKNAKLESLVESIVFESIEAIRDQVKVKEWQQRLKEHDTHPSV